ncbi:hypothetical protein [Sunxiuqinia elliptica]|uniref:Arylsulfatase-like protein n=1 Tax=Sunxiuqinia elliptica TaxID=655355 RepID=A0A4R6HD03_9BACT|nr:hypothetical protein [Sunxiuqinia elliptica]TDO05701.1 arylsulfatase-like protein [Sunxiuqinia elliptica]TDO65243.1 arylsulfatase-like protein [Sunxiuqinia elliptica]
MAEKPTDRAIDGRDIRSLLMPSENYPPVEDFRFLYSYFENQPSAIRAKEWKLHVRIGSQTKNNYGYEASRETPLLFQVEEDLGERIDLADQESEKVSEFLLELEHIERQLKDEGSFWDQE